MLKYNHLVSGIVLGSQHTSLDYARLLCQYAYSSKVLCYQNGVATTMQASHTLLWLPLGNQPTLKEEEEKKR